MPPKARAGKARYKEGRDYFKAAYRERIKERYGGRWTNSKNPDNVLDDSMEEL